MASEIEKYKREFLEYLEIEKGSKLKIKYSTCC